MEHGWQGDATRRRSSAQVPLIHRVRARALPFRGAEGSCAPAAREGFGVVVARHGEPCDQSSVLVKHGRAVGLKTAARRANPSQRRSGAAKHCKALSTHTVRHRLPLYRQKLWREACQKET